jgi:hypothetical protein
MASQFFHTVSDRRRRLIALHHLLRKYGTAMSMAPIATSRIEFETKYGNTIRHRPQSNGTTALWRLP